MPESTGAVAGGRWNDHYTNAGNRCPQSLRPVPAGTADDQMCPDGCLAGRPGPVGSLVQESLAAVVSRAMTVGDLTCDPWAGDHAVGFHLRGGGRETYVWLSPAPAGLWPGLYVMEGRELCEGQQQFYVHLTSSGTPETWPGRAGQPPAPPQPEPAPDAWTIWALSQVVTSDDGATTYVPWGADRAVGYRVTSPGQDPVYVCLSPSADADGRPALLVYAGPYGTTDDTPATFIHPFGPHYYPAGQAADASAERRLAAEGAWARPAGSGPDRGHLPRQPAAGRHRHARH